MGCGSGEGLPGSFICLMSTFNCILFWCWRNFGFKNGAVVHAKEWPGTGFVGAMVFRKIPLYLTI